MIRLWYIWQCRVCGWHWAFEEDYELPCPQCGEDDLSLANSHPFHGRRAAVAELRRMEERMI